MDNEIQQLEDITRLCAAIPTAVAKITADGKWDASDIAYLVPLLMKTPAVLSGVSMTWDEMKKLNPVNAERLITAAKEELELPNDPASEAIVEEVVSVSFRIAGMIVAIAAAQKAAAPKP